MVHWQEFDPSDIEYDFDADELARHRVTYNEAVQCLFNDFLVRRDKVHFDRYRIFGTTDGGRRLLLIVQAKPGNVVRIITGWQR